MPDPLAEALPEPNWDKLPQEFHYLIPATKALSEYCGRAEDFDPTDEEEEFLERTAEEIRKKGGFEPILDWVIEHEEFFVVGRVLALMEELGFRLS